MLNDRLFMHSSRVVLAYCDEVSLLHMEVLRPHVISEPPHTLGGEVLA